MLLSKRNHERPAAGNSPIYKAVELLEELLMHTLPVRDLYKSARCRDADIHFRPLRPLFDSHYKEQLRLVDVLVDRIRELGGESRVLAGALLQRGRLSYALRGHLGRTRLLSDLLDAHELVLSAACTDRGRSQPAAPSAVHDFAVGQVVLVNDAQGCSVREQLVRFDQQSARVAQSEYSYRLQD
jgi:starvation-inducible DNA-binding protein